MTFKNAAAGLAHGGAKSVIFADPAMEPDAKERLIRTFARCIEHIEDYIPGPDMGTDETAMAWVLDEIGRCAGLPPEVGGIPLDEIGATGFGVVTAARVACERSGMSLDGAKIAIQGFGAVGMHAARFFAGQGALLVAAADSSGTVFDSNGLDVESVIEFKVGGGHLCGFAFGAQLARDEVITIDCDILVPAARPDAVREDNAPMVKARLIAPGANIGVTGAAERMLHDRGVMCLPDFIANADGVICAAVEFHGGTQSQAFDTIEERIRSNTTEMLARTRAGEMLPRQAAETMARERVEKAMRLRR